MSWKYKKPQRDDYDTEEDYEEACEDYDNALDDYCAWVEEHRRG